MEAPARKAAEAKARASPRGARPPPTGAGTRGPVTDGASGRPPAGQEAAPAVGTPKSPATVPAAATGPAGTASASDTAPTAPPGRLTLIGVGHVFQVAQTIRDAIFALRPDIVFIELDKSRLMALVERQRTGKMPEPGKAGFVHGRLAHFQERVAKSYGADVGEEMLAAALAGRDIGARVRLVDPPAANTVGLVMKELTWRERARGLGMGLQGLVAGLFRKQPSIEQELRRYEEDPEAVLEELRRAFPTVHRIVIAERDRIMADRIRRGLAGAVHGVAVVGDGHVGGMLRHLKGIEVTTYRLADVRERRLPRPEATIASGDTSSVSFSFTSDPTQGAPSGPSKNA